MKRIIRFLAIAFLFSNALYFTSCTEDDPGGGGGGGTNPSVTITNIPFDDLTPGGVLTITVSASPGTADLNAIEVQEDGVRIPASQITSIQGISTPNNPFLIDATGFSGDISIQVPDTEGSYTYKFIATDKDLRTGEDEFTITVAKARPNVSVFGGPTTDVTAGSDFTITLDAIVGEAQLGTLLITENGVDLPLSRLFISGLVSFGNPHTIDGADKDGLSYGITITAPSRPGTYEYIFTVTDELAESDNDSFTIEVVGTALTGDLSGVLFNAAGPAGKGTLDLDEGRTSGVSTSDLSLPNSTTPDETEIRDLGNDCTVLPPNESWRMQIGAFNGSVLKEVDITQIENFNFDNVGTVEQIVEAFNTGIELGGNFANACGPGDPDIPVDHVSEVISVGDLFVVQSANGTHYLIRVDEVNATGNSSNADDNFVMSIKY